MSNEIRCSISDSHYKEFIKIKEKLNFTINKEAIEFLITNYVLQEQIRLSEKMISKQVTEILLENLEPTIEKIYTKTRYIDKNSQITLDMVNHLLVGENLDATYAHSIKNDPTKVYKLIVEEMSKDIENKQVKKNYREGNEV